jgi:anti-sigma-K factor RskA
VATVAVGAVAVCVLTSDRLRGRAAAILQQAWDRSREAARVLVRGAPAGTPPHPPQSPTAERVPRPTTTGSRPAPRAPEPETVLLDRVAPTPEPEPVPQQPVPLPTPDAGAGRARRRFAVGAAIAAVACALVAAASASWQVWGTSDDSGGVLAANKTKPAQTAEQANARKLVAQPGRLILPLARTKARLTIVVGHGDRAVLVGTKLPTAPSGKQYEIWVIQGGTPVRAGLFRGGGGRLVVPLTRSVPAGSTVAVTLEKRGGAAAPTTKPLFKATRTQPSFVQSVLSDKHAVHLPLAHSGGKVNVVVGGHDRAVLVSTRLPVAPTGKQYEIWVIQGKSVQQAGLFAGGTARGVVPLTRPVPAGATVAVTVERLGGVAAPTAKPLYFAARSKPSAASSILSQPGALQLPLLHSGGKVTVVVGTRNRAVLVSANLAAAPAGKQYEVWVIRGASVARAGLFRGGPARNVVPLARAVPHGAVVAVTIERHGGVAAPTHDPIYLVKRP